MDYEIASRPDDIRDALGLVYQAYLQTGLIEPHRSKMRLTRHHLLPTSEVLVAKSRGRVICTATLVRDNGRLGLPMEAIYADEVALRRIVSLRMAETTCLACSPDTKTPLSVVTRVMALAIQCAKARGMDELLAVVHPDHADFYTGFLGFEAFGGVKLYPSVRHHPAVAISLDLNGLRDRHPKGYKRAFLPPFPRETLRYRPLHESAYEQLQRLLEGDVLQEAGD